MSEYSEAQAKADADALVAKLEADPALREALLNDPHATLIAEGLPADTVAGLEKALFGDEVEGFLMPSNLSGGMQTVNCSNTTAQFGGLGKFAGTQVGFTISCCYFPNNSPQIKE